MKGYVYNFVMALKDPGQPIEFTVTGVEKWDNNPDTPEEDWTDVNATVND